VSHTPLEDLTDRIRPRSASSVLLWAILAFFAIFVVWAMLTKLDRTVHAVGRVVPTAQLQVVSNLEGGIVQEILAKPGTVVRANDPLIRLDTTASGGDFNANQSAFARPRTLRSRSKLGLSGRCIFRASSTCKG
jgi:adhesin transport system membrane fusion protein